MSEITSNFNTVRKYISKPIEKARAEGETRDFWRFVRGSANVFAKVTFNPDELAVLLSLNSDLFNKMMRWDGIHNGMLDVLRFYGQRRGLFLDGLPAEMGEGDCGAAVLSPEQHAVAAPRMAELDSLLEQLRRQTEEDTRSTWPLLQNLHECFQNEFGLRYKIGPNPLVEMPSTEPVVVA